MRSWKWAFGFGGIVIGVIGSAIIADEEQIALDKAPEAVIKSVKNRFPKAELTEAAKETEDGKTVYEISVKDNGVHVDVTLQENGDILLIEKEIPSKDLPTAVSEALKKKYPNASFRLSEEVTKVDKGKEKVDYYEVKLELEIEVTPEGALKNDQAKPDADDDKGK